jgi:hypothetical protein
VESVTDVIEGVGFPRGSTLPSIREGESVPDGCRWPTIAIRDLTMVVADAALAADPLFNLGPGGHVGWIEMRHWYVRPDLKYLTCQACHQRGDQSVIGPEAVACQHQMSTG